MILKQLLLLALSCIPSFLLSQNYTARIVDSVSQEPIAFATVQTGEFSGVVTNQEGVFSINLDDLDTSENQFEVSCLGYATKSISPSEVEENNGIIELSPQVNELDTVFLMDKNLPLDSILTRTQRHAKTNYRTNLMQYDVFSRKSSYTEGKDFEVKISKASGIRKKHLKPANKSIDSFIRVLRNSNSKSYRDLAGKLMVSSPENKKLNVKKATNLRDKKVDFSEEKLTKDFTKLILKYLDTTQTYTLKSGWFKIDDSLTFDNKKNEETGETETSLTIDTGDKNKQPPKEVNNRYVLLNKTLFREEAFLVKFLSTKYYDHNIKDLSVYQGQPVYVIEFLPRKRKARYTGTLYITADDYALVRTDYRFADGKHGQKLNLKLLVGVKFEEFLNNGTVMFSKSNNGYYVPKYVFEERKMYFYVDRNLIFKENEGEKRKTKFDFLIEGIQHENSQTLFYSPNEITEEQYEAAPNTSDIKFEHQDHYDPDMWKAYNAIEPLEEMKQFKSVE